MNQLTYADVCKKLKTAGLPCSRRTVNYLVSSGELTPHRFNGIAVLFNQAQVKRYIAQTRKEKKP